jgi:hypothetical protein
MELATHTPHPPGCIYSYSSCLGYVNLPKLTLIISSHLISPRLNLILHWHISLIRNQLHGTIPQRFMASYTPELQAHPGSAPPPPPPPKPSSHDATRISTPTTIGEAGSVMSGAPTPYEYSSGSVPPPPPSRVAAGTAAGTQQQQQQQQPAEVPDPGDQWLPQILQDKS